MLARISPSRRLFLIINGIILIGAALTCVLPMIYVLSLSLSSSTAVAAGDVKLFPVGFNLQSYTYVFGKAEFMRSFLNSILRVAIGVPIMMIVNVLMAYPLSKEKKQFKARGFFMWSLIGTMLFSGGLIPGYILVSRLGMIDSIWSLVIPGCIAPFYVILVLNFIRSLPKEMEEAAYIDGASQLHALWNVILPLSMPVLATVTLFSFVGHWNSWFDGLIYMRSNLKYPLQSLLHTMVITADNRILNPSQVKELKFVNNRTLRSAEIFVAMVPILLVYPFLQRHFTTGIVLGSVKG